MAGDSQTILSVLKALRLLEVFTRETPCLSLAELSRRSGLPKTVVFRLVHTLEERHFLMREEPGNRYRIGPRAFQVGSLYRVRNQLLEHGERAVADLRQAHNCTAQLCVLDGTEALVVAMAESHSVVRIVARLGSRLALHVTASGKVLLAHCGELAGSQLLHFRELRAHTSRSITDPQQLAEELARVRRQGYALSEDEYAVGVWAAAAPVRDHTGATVAALAVAVPTTQTDLGTQPVLISAVRAAADKLSRQLGAPGPKGVAAR